MGRVFWYGIWSSIAGAIALNMVVGFGPEVGDIEVTGGEQGGYHIVGPLEAEMETIFLTVLMAAVLFVAQGAVLFAAGMVKDWVRERRVSKQPGTA